MFSPFRLSACFCLAACLFLTGCGGADPKVAKADPKAEKHDDHDGHDHGKGGSHEHSTDGWWCNEHGIPEDVCSMCSSKVAADFQKKNDWCKEHDRADSQCFKCHPELEAKFAAQFEAKYGRKPPKPTE